MAGIVVGGPSQGEAAMDLLGTGSRGHGDLASPLLGWTGQYAGPVSCPVVVREA